MNHSQVILREARIEDIESVMELVKELAIFEKAEKEMVATKKMYLDGFHDKTFEICIAEIDEKVVGMTLYYYGFSTWKGKMLFLEDFVVMDKYRSHGIGQMLFDKLILDAKKENCAMLKWQVLDWNVEAIKFYMRQNAMIDKGWYNGKIFL